MVMGFIAATLATIINPIAGMVAFVAVSALGITYLITRKDDNDE